MPKTHTDALLFQESLSHPQPQHTGPLSSPPPPSSPDPCHAAQIVVNELIFKLLCSYRRENQA